MAAAHGGRADVLEALDSAAREGVIELDDSSLRFAHPLLASICYEQAKPWKRRAVHGALARTVTDLEERARHMALSVEGPDAFAASQLDAAAEQAAARGATAAAAELCEMAAQLTPDDPGLAHRRRIRSAGLYRLAGEESGPWRCSRSSSGRFRKGWSGPTSSSNSHARIEPINRRRSRSWTMP